MDKQRAYLAVTTGPNEGDTVGFDIGTCRLVGRHLSESETSFLDRDGNRMLDGSALELVAEHFKQRLTEAKPAEAASANSPPSPTFERGPDIILADDSISRAHAMVFYDTTGVGIIDLASTNGTYVGGRPVSSCLLSEGDVISIGNSELVLRF